MSFDNKKKRLLGSWLNCQFFNSPFCSRACANRLIKILYHFKVSVCFRSLPARIIIDNVRNKSHRGIQFNRRNIVGIHRDCKIAGTIFYQLNYLTQSVKCWISSLPSTQSELRAACIYPSFIIFLNSSSTLLYSNI